MKCKLLLLGSIPPPAGGVTIHVQRLIAFLTNEHYSFTFCHVRKSSFYRILCEIHKHNFVHIHISNIYVCFFLCLYCKLVCKKLIMTRHGSIDRHTGLIKFFDFASIYLAYLPIVLNDASYKLAKKYNHAVIKVSPFIPPATDSVLPDYILQTLSSAKQKYKYVFSACASDLTFTSQHLETYGVTELISVFCSFPEYFLIITTRSPNYYNYLLQNKTHIPDNIFIVQEPVDFFTVVKNTDVMIRHTMTDGDSLAVREAIYLQKPVIASDCVSRPPGTITYHTLEDLRMILASFNLSQIPSNIHEDKANNAHTLLQIYRSLE